jgi:regulator of nonsense transcripts 1
MSQPYTYGYLSGEIVLLLSALGVPTDVFLRKQAAHFDWLRMAVEDPIIAFRFLCSLDRFDLAEKVVLNGIGGVSGSLRSLVTAEFKRMLNKRGDHRCRIFLPESRLLFGICDPLGVLEEGECYLRVTDESSEWVSGSNQRV